MITEHAPATWIRRPCAVFTANDLDAAGGIVVRGDRIVELVGAGEEPRTPIDEVFDASGLVLLPGLINGHHHFYQTLTRACPPALDKSLFDWLKALYPIWANLTEEAIAVSTRLALAELTLSRLHHRQRSPLPVLRCADPGDRRSGRGGGRAGSARGCSRAAR